MNQRTFLAAVAVAILGTAALAETADAQVVTFRGTRDQVRAACASVGGSLGEQSGSTSCVNGPKHTSVSCDNAGNCVGVVPRMAAGATGVLAVLGGMGQAAAIDAGGAGQPMRGLQSE